MTPQFATPIDEPPQSSNPITLPLTPADVDWSIVRETAKRVVIQATIPWGGDRLAVQREIPVNRIGTYHETLLLLEIFEVLNVRPNPDVLATLPCPWHWRRWSCDTHLRHLQPDTTTQSTTM